MTALIAMHVGLNELLHWHYQLQRKWWISSKRLLGDLRNWDYRLAALVEDFVATSEVQAKFQFWSAIIDHILEPLGGRQPIAENNCHCDICQRDLATLLPRVGRPRGLSTVGVWGDRQNACSSLLIFK